MSKYAAGTSVPADRTRSEIEKTLARYGATSFAYATDARGAVIQFDLAGRRIRLAVRFPNRADREFTRTATGRPRAAAEAERAFDQAVRQRWRALLLVLKAKLEAVDSGIAALEDEFLAYVVNPQTGRTVGEDIAPQLRAAYEQPGAMPPPLMLPGSDG